MARLPQTAAVYLQSNQEQWRRLMHESNNCFSGKLKKRKYEKISDLFSGSEKESESDGGR